VKNQRPYRITLLSLLLISLSSLVWTPSHPSSGPSFEDQLEQGLSFYKKEDYAQALRIFQGLEEEIGEHPLRPETIFMQGQALRALADSPGAAQAFSRSASPSENGRALLPIGCFS
jgi:hypothetical protein